MSITTKLIILAVNKKEASVVENKRCRYCGANRAVGHMEMEHPEQLAAYYEYISDKDNDQFGEKIREASWTPKWHRWGNRIG